MNNRPSYPFERKRFSYRDEKRSEVALAVFVDRLGLPEQVSQALNEELVDYVTDMHLRISWYEQKLNRERVLSGFYISLTIVLMAAIPALIYYFSGQIEADTGIAEIAAVLSGVLAIHKGFASWLEQRRVIGDFWKAMADLKEALYDLEDKHRKEGKNWDEAAQEDLKKDLQLGIQFAQRVERKEREKFFKNYKTPKFDLVGSLSSIGKKSEDITELYLSPDAEDILVSAELYDELAEDLLEAQTEVIQFEFEREELLKLIDIRSQELQNAPPDELSAMKSGLRELRIKLERVEANLISARGEVLALKNALGISDPS